MTSNVKMTGVNHHGRSQHEHIPLSGGHAVADHRQPASGSRICFLSGDNFGIGHIHHNSRVANTLLERHHDISALVVTGTESDVLPPLANGGDYLHMPSIIRLASGVRRPARLRIEFGELVGLRSALFDTVLREFEPEIIYVHHLTNNTRREIDVGLHSPHGRSALRILALDHLLNHASVVSRDWLDNRLAEYAADNFDQIWVFGDQETFDFGAEYRLPAAMQRKMSYLGYFPRRIPLDKRMELRRYYRSRLELDDSDQLVIVTGGGGRDAVALYQRYLRCLPSLPKNVVTLLITGPLMPERGQRQLSRLIESCRDHRVCIEAYLPDLQYILPAADAVVGMGGAGTVLEVMVACCPAVVVPRGIWASGQQARGRLVREKGWLPVLPLSAATPDRIAKVIQELLVSHPREVPLRLGGIDRARRRLSEAVVH